MKTKLLFLLLAFLASSCSETSEDVPLERGREVTLVAAEVTPRTTRSGESASQTSLFKSGDIITVVGAAEEDVVFVLASDNKWRTLKSYSWKPNPEQVKAYFGASTTINDGDEMPDMLIATYECNGTIPQGGELSFTEDGAFSHATALVEVEINNWQEPTNPNVVLGDFHRVVSMEAGGKYVNDPSVLYSINLKLVSETSTTLIYQARVPVDDNVVQNYSLMINNLNALEYIVDTSVIPTTYDAGKRFVFSLDFDYTQP